MNGDGLPDYFSAGQVRLSMGAETGEGHFTAAGIGSLTESVTGSESTNANAGLGGNIFEKVEKVLAALPEGGVQEQQGQSLAVGANIGGGLSVSNSSTQTKSLLSDLNGDGLPDHVYTTDSGEAYVRWNTGSAFASAERLHLPA